jgi:hypothetical protein
MAGLVLAIHVFCGRFKDVDARDKPGHDAQYSSHQYRIAGRCTIGIMATKTGGSQAALSSEETDKTDESRSVERGAKE